MDMRHYYRCFIVVREITPMLPVLRQLSLVALAALTAGTAAHDVQVGPIGIAQARARATVAGQPAGGGFITLSNKGTSADRLIGASAPVAATVEIHTMRMEGDVMRMRPVDAIELPAGETVELKPGGMHMMFMGLKAPLKAGEGFPLTLRFEKAGEMTIHMHIEAATGAPAPAHKH
jgi:copper(I)-binding protein